MIVIRDSSVVPPGVGWAYYVEGTNYTVSTKIFTQIYPMVVAHCTANNVYVPTYQEVVEQMCQRLKIPCQESDGGYALVNAWSLDLPVAPLKGCCG
jgi:hypothetical protein